jgi:hypothetical protein
MANDIIVVTHRGGLNEDAPHSLRDDECTEANDVEFWLSMLGERRAGCAQLASLPANLTNRQTMCHISQWFPTNDPTLPEFVAAAADPGSAFAISRRDTAGAWSNLAPGDTVDNAAPYIYRIQSQALDASNYLAIKTNQNRLQVLDSGGVWRRVGIAAPAAPTGVDTVTAGIFKGVRYYRQRSVYVSGSAVLRRSEPSTVLTFTPNGAKNGVTITKGADAAGESSTHWEIEASLDNSNFYRLARTINATTTYVDTRPGRRRIPARGAGSPASTDGTGITYVLLSNQAAQLNLTGTVSNGVYSDGTNIGGRGWIGYTSADAYIPLTASTAWAAGRSGMRRRTSRP